MLKLIPVFALAVLVSACAPQMAVTTAPFEVNVTDEAAVAGAVGREPVFVRTYVGAENTSKTEIKDVPCEAKGQGFDAQVVTPAILKLPDFDGLSKPVQVVCTKDSATSAGVAKPFNRTSANLMAGSGSAGLLGVLIAAGYDAARSKTGDDWGYQNVDVFFSQ